MPEEVLELLELDEEDEEDELLELDELELEELLVVEELLEDELLDDELLPGSPDPLPHADIKKSKVKMVRRFAALFFIFMSPFCFGVLNAKSLVAMLENSLFKGQFPDIEFRTKTKNFGEMRKIESFL